MLTKNFNHILLSIFFFLSLIAMSKAYSSKRLHLEEESGYELHNISSSSHLQTNSQFHGITDEHVENFFKNSTNLVCIIDYGHKFIRLNHKWIEIFGYQETELLDQPYIDFVHPKDIKQTLDYEQDIIPINLVNRYRCKNGLYRWLDWIGLPHFSRDSNSSHRFAIACDVTLKKVHEKYLRNQLQDTIKQDDLATSALLEAAAIIQSAQLSDLINTNNSTYNKRTLKVSLCQFIHLTQSDFGFITEVCHDQFHKLTFKQHWQESNLAHKDILIYCQNNNHHDTTNYQSDPFLTHMLSKQEPWIVDDFQTVFPPASIPALYSQIRSFLAIPFRSQNHSTGIIGLAKPQDLIGIIGIANRSTSYTEQLLSQLQPLQLIVEGIIDEVKQKRWMKELSEERRKCIQAEESSQAKSLFIAHMSHEIRTPLTSIIGHLELVDKQSLTPSNLECIENAQNSTQALFDIANDVLDISKFEAGLFKLEQQEFSFQRLVQELAQTLQPEAEAKHLQLLFLTDANIPVKLKGDPMRVRQILRNLFVNAIKFTHQGSIQANFKGQTVIHQPDNFLLEGKIVDTGIGMNSATIDQLFKLFKQGDSAMHRQFGGTGLGLYITKQLCNYMGGEIIVDSQLNQGSTFAFKIHLQKISQSILPSILPDTQVLPTLDVLVAEDNLMTQKLLKSLLTRLGLKSTIVSNGLEAYKAVQLHPYDMVLMDGEMPVMNGLEATAKIRECFSEQELPIIGVTAHTLPGDREQFMSLGFNGYLTKPLKPTDLKSEILRCMKNKL